MSFPMLQLSFIININQYLFLRMELVKPVLLKSINSLKKQFTAFQKYMFRAMSDVSLRKIIKLGYCVSWKKSY